MSQKPYRMNLHFVFAADDAQDAEIMFGSVVDWAEMQGGILEVGSVTEMPADDVIPESPLARQLAAFCRGGRGAHTP